MTKAASIDVGDLIEGQRFGRFQAGLMFWICAFMLIEGYDMQVVGYAAPAIIKAWHSDKAAFGAVFGAGLGGFMLGATLLGNFGDRFGRKHMIVAGSLLFGFFTLASAWADGLTSLLVLRTIAGIGLGGSIPNAIALVAEYAPARDRATRVGVMFIGYTIGSALGGVIAARLIPTWGWPSVFVVGGVLPIAIGLLPPVRPDLAVPDNASLAIEEENKEGLPVAHLFADGRASMTVLLWLAYAANMISLHFLTSWLPTVVSESGVPLAHAVMATALLQGGGAVGSLVVGRLLDRIGTLGIVAAFLVAVPCVAALGHVGTSEAPLLALVIVVGLCVIGGQVGINALAGTLYPTYMRSTGTGWAFGVGRVGSILGPVIGGQLLAFGLPLGMLFAAASMPILISASALFFLGRLAILRNRAAGTAAQSTAMPSPLYQASGGRRP